MAFLHSCRHLETNFCLSQHASYQVMLTCICHEVRAACGQVQYAAKRGFYLVAAVPGSTTKGSDLPAGPLPSAFLQLEQRGRSHVSCTTHELKALNARLQDALSDCLMLTAQVYLNCLRHPSSAIERASRDNVTEVYLRSASSFWLRCR